MDAHEQEESSGSVGQGNDRSIKASDVPVKPPPRFTKFEPSDPFNDAKDNENITNNPKAKLADNPNYLMHWRHFTSFCGVDAADSLSSGQLTVSQVDTLLADFIRTRVNLKVMKKVSRIIRPTVSSVICHFSEWVCSKIGYLLIFCHAQPTCHYVHCEHPLQDPDSTFLQVEEHIAVCHEEV